MIFTLIPIWHFEGKKPLTDHLQQGFGQQSKTGASSIYIENTLLRRIFLSNYRFGFTVRTNLETIIPKIGSKFNGRELK